MIAQMRNQRGKAYGEHNCILDNCHVRVAVATNDERTAKPIADALGTATEQRAMRNYAGHRLAPWLAHVMVSRQETARALLTPGEVMQLPATDELVLVAGTPPIRATKLRYFEDGTFKARVLPPPTLSDGDYADRPAERADDWAGIIRGTDARLGAVMDDAGDDVGGGIEQARHPGQEIARPQSPDTISADPLGLGDDEGDPATDQRAMDQARVLGTARTVYAMDAGADGSDGHRPGDLQLDL